MAGLDKEKRKAYMQNYQKEYCHRFKEKHGISPQTAYRRRDPEAAARHRETERGRFKSSPEHRQRHNTLGRIHRNKLKVAAYAAYGGFICACCGETHELFLSLDHVNNDGAQARQSLHPISGGALYAWLKHNNYPEGFQVLCMNCNCGKARNGGVCPHVTD